MPPLEVSETADALPAPPTVRKGTVGLLLMRSYLLAGNADHYNGVITALEARGLLARKGQNSLGQDQDDTVAEDLRADRLQGLRPRVAEDVAVLGADHRVDGVGDRLHLP